uniref:Uncharacterized protein n=1 Tax=Timema douglasi TaxID=61478 RepID=A0A7R8VPD5_TIMDO|nr:unnamed protein product [Timema douglasi]
MIGILYDQHGSGSRVYCPGEHLDHFINGANYVITVQIINKKYGISFPNERYIFGLRFINIHSIIKRPL